MNDIQELEFKLLLKLDEVCRKHGLTYYLAYGTCIGAVRHKGFIPWDHDIDVLMPFDDAKKLLKYQNEFGKEYFLSCFRNDRNNHTTKFYLCDRNHDCEVVQNGRTIEKSKVGMDIYPFYRCPPSKKKLLFNILRSHLYRMLVGGVPNNHGVIAKAIGKIVQIAVPVKKRKRIIKKLENKLNYKGEYNEITVYYGLDITFTTAILYRKEWFSKPSELEFEGHLFYAPTNPDKYLKTRYGDYMTPVSQEEKEKEMSIQLIN